MLGGGHNLDRIDIAKARQIHLRIYKFLEPYLKPPRPFKTVDDLTRVAYRYQAGSLQGRLVSAPALPSAASSEPAQLESRGALGYIEDRQTLMHSSTRATP